MISRICKSTFFFIILIIGAYGVLAACPSGGYLTSDCHDQGTTEQEHDAACATQCWNYCWDTGDAHCVDTNSDCVWFSPENQYKCMCVCTEAVQCNLDAQCDDDNACTIDTCYKGKCGYTNVPNLPITYCDDQSSEDPQDPCTPEICVNGTCVSLGEDPTGHNDNKDCEDGDGNPCTGRCENAQCVNKKRIRDLVEVECAVTEDCEEFGDVCNTNQEKCICQFGYIIKLEPKEWYTYPEIRDAETGEILQEYMEFQVLGPVEVSSNPVFAVYNLGEADLLDLGYAHYYYEQTTEGEITTTRIIDDSPYDQMAAYDPLSPQNTHGKIILFDYDTETVTVCNEKGHSIGSTCNSEEIIFDRVEIELGTTKQFQDGKQVTAGIITYDGLPYVAVSGEIDADIIGSKSIDTGIIPEFSTSGLVIAFVLVVIGVILIVNLIVKKRKV